MPKMSVHSEDEYIEDIRYFFLDSGAHSLYNAKAYKKGGQKKYSFYETDEFWSYVDEYVTFVKKYREHGALDWYANVDVIHNAELSWKVQKYLEKQGLSPVPVVHHGTSLTWLKKYLKEGYDYIALGGVALTSTQRAYMQWADQMFNCICATRDKLPSVRVHGFAMTAYNIMVRYPFYSLDSASWAKAAAFGSIYVPRTKLLKYDFKMEPYNIAISEEQETPTSKIKGKHFSTLSPSQGADGVAAGYIRRWLDEIDVPLGSVSTERVEKKRKNNKKGTVKKIYLHKMKEWGVRSNYQARKIANLKFFKRMAESLPEWPWPFHAEVRQGFFE